MPAMTSIKVPVPLRDRLAARARADHTTLAGALQKVLDETDEQQFWSAVRAAHAGLRDGPVHDGPVRDDLPDAADDRIGSDGW